MQHPSLRAGIDAARHDRKTSQAVAPEPNRARTLSIRANVGRSPVVALRNGTQREKRKLTREHIRQRGRSETRFHAGDEERPRWRA